MTIINSLAITMLQVNIKKPMAPLLSHRLLFGLTAFAKRNNNLIFK